LASRTSTSANLDVPFLYRLDFVLEARALSGAEAGHEQVRSASAKALAVARLIPLFPNQKDALPEKS
jgi:hypothetical protein